MKAFELRDFRGPQGLVLVDRDLPIEGADELLVRVGAIGVNFPDLLMTQGNYQLKPELPVVPGCEVAGTVVSAPEHSRIKVGDRVAAFVWTGGYAEHAVVPVAHAARVPEQLTTPQGAASVVNYHTVYYALSRRGGVRDGDTVLVLGAGGGIGSAALQVASGLGAQVLAGVATEEQAETASRALPGAEMVFLREGFSRQVFELTSGAGVDTVVDPLGDWIFDEAIRCLAPEGALVVVGFAAGAIPTVAANRLLLRNVSVVGAAFGATLARRPGLMQSQAVALEGLIAQGAIRPEIEGIGSFDSLPEQLTRLERGLVRGKAVVEVN